MNGIRVPSISTNQTITSNIWIEKTPWLIYGMGNPCPGLGQAWKCGRVNQ
jgi:hypothetical protein